MADLTAAQYYQVAVIHLLSAAAMAAATIHLAMMRPKATPRYRPVATLSALFCFVAAAGYLWLCWSWTGSFTVADGSAKVLNGFYDDRHRYADWLLTVPLQLVAFAVVLDTLPRKTRFRAAVLALAGAEMVLMGYAGEVSATTDARWLWFAAGLVPFLLIIAHLYRGMGEDIAAEAPEARQLLSTARLALVMCWPVYAAIFALQTLGYDGPNLFVATQAAYSAADIGAKIVFAIMLCRAAVLKSAPPARHATQDSFGPVPAAPPAPVQEA